MDTLLQQFETPVAGKDGDRYVVYLYGRSRPGDTWQGWLVFERVRDGSRFSTPVETTQPDAQAVSYWGTGLSSAYFDGALERALHPVVYQPARQSLSHVEREVLRHLAAHARGRVLMQNLFDEIAHAHADIVRAVENLEQRERMLVRRTEEGNDWVFLTSGR
jgi:hypothetical protein